MHQRSNAEVLKRTAVPGGDLAGAAAGGRAVQSRQRGKQSPARAGTLLPNRAEADARTHSALLLVWKLERLYAAGDNEAVSPPKLSQQIHHILLVIPQMIDPSVPIGKDDSCNVEVERFGEATVPAFDIPYHTDIMERFDGIDLDAAGRVSGNGFYYLMGDIARLHEAVLAYGRDFMINKGFTYCIPPFMIHGSVVEGVMSQTDMDAMMYKIEGEDLYLIGTSEHSMIGKFIDQIVPVESLPQTLTSYSPLLPQGEGRPRHRGAGHLPHPPV